MIKTLTSLRMFFALMVFGAHCYVIDSHFDAHVFKEGFVGVTFFFVLSGFIIAYNYQNKITEQRTSKREFWVARIARVYPLHILTLLIAALVGGYIEATGTMDWIGHFLMSVFLLHPLIPSADYFFSFNSPSWSLGCEQLFYFLFPFLVPLFCRNNRIFYLLLLCFIATCVGMSFTPEENIKGFWYVNPITRFPDFLIGMALYQVYIKCQDRKLSYTTASLLEVGSILLFLLFYLFSGDVLSKVYRYSCYYWIPIALLLFIFSLQKGALSRLLSNKYLLIGGEISFSFYLIHLFIIHSYIKIIAMYQLQISWMIAIPAIFCLTTGLSLLSYYYFEKPVNKWVKQLLNK